MYDFFNAVETFQLKSVKTIDFKCVYYGFSPEQNGYYTNYNYYNYNIYIYITLYNYDKSSIGNILLALLIEYSINN